MDLIELTEKTRGDVPAEVGFLNRKGLICGQPIPEFFLHPLVGWRRSKFAGELATDLLMSVMHHEYADPATDDEITAHLQSLVDQVHKEEAERQTKPAVEGLVESKWQAIETAPMNAIRVIAAANDFVLGDIYFGKGPVLLIRGGDAAYVNERFEDAWRYSEGGRKVEKHLQPTHWMELPNPPVTKLDAQIAARTKGEVKT